MDQLTTPRRVGFTLGIKTRTERVWDFALERNRKKSEAIKVAESKITKFTAGWWFWSILFLILAGPCIYAGWRFTDKDSFPVMRISIGAIVAAIASGLVAWAINAILQFFGRKQRIAERKKVKKNRR